MQFDNRVLLVDTSGDVVFVLPHFIQCGERKELRCVYFTMIAALILG